MDFIWSNVVICSVDVNFHLEPLFQAPHYSQCMSITATILRLTRGPPTSGKSKSIHGTFPDYSPGLQLFQLKGFLYSACNFEMLGIYKLFLLHLLVQLLTPIHTLSSHTALWHGVWQIWRTTSFCSFSVCLVSWSYSHLCLMFSIWFYFF